MRTKQSLNNFPLTYLTFKHEHQWIEVPLPAPVGPVCLPLRTYLYLYVFVGIVDFFASSGIAAKAERVRDEAAVAAIDDAIDGALDALDAVVICCELCFESVSGLVSALHYKSFPVGAQVCCIRA